MTNNMHLRNELLAPKKLVGKSLKMSLANNRTPELWRSFMPRRKEIKNAVGNDLYSLQVYDKEASFQGFKPSQVFTKYAVVEVGDFVLVPEGMETFVLEGGLYAVFFHQGLASDFPKTMQYIFLDWLPNTTYELDHRPHFEVLGEKYKNNDPRSEEEIWIPIRKK